MSKVENWEGTGRMAWVYEDPNGIKFFVKWV